MVSKSDFGSGSSGSSPLFPTKLSIVVKVRRAGSFPNTESFQNQRTESIIES